jgi:hypothetical protein
VVREPKVVGEKNAALLVWHLPREAFFFAKLSPDRSGRSFPLEKVVKIESLNTCKAAETFGGNQSHRLGAEPIFSDTKSIHKPRRHLYCGRRVTSAPLFYDLSRGIPIEAALPACTQLPLHSN